MVEELFNGLLAGIEEEINRLISLGVFDSYLNTENRWNRCTVLNQIFQEHTIRYIALRQFYKSGNRSEVKFETEVQRNGGPIDLVFYLNEKQYAFEFKRWQGGSEKRSILMKDYVNLTGFVDSPNRQGFELIFTNNDFKKLKEDYIEEFESDLGEKYELHKCEVKEFDKSNVNNDGKFTICLMLAEPK